MKHTLTFNPLANYSSPKSAIISTVTTCCNKGCPGACDRSYLYIDVDDSCYIASRGYSDGYPNCLCQEWVIRTLESGAPIEFDIHLFDVSSRVGPGTHQRLVGHQWPRVNRANVT